jgi:glycosyltransferase involved in cell wall biosynthesis
MSPMQRTRKGNLLIVAFHFPPYAASSGPLRPLKFSRYLPEFDWSTTVLTINPFAYERADYHQWPRTEDEPAVIRAFGLDARKHLSIRGRYPKLAALPDRWGSWCLAAIPAGLRAIQERHIDVILTTFPIASAVLIGYILHKLTRKPWVVDFRDPMVHEGSQLDPLTGRIWRWLEEKAVSCASRLIFTAPSALRMYLKRYPQLAKEKCLLVVNGYDEEDFKDLRIDEPIASPSNRPLRLLHTGLLYSKERDPRPFFRAVARLKREGLISPFEVQIQLRGSGNEREYASMIEELDLDGLIQIFNPLPYREALQECADSDGLLLFQGDHFDRQIPAKTYEYLRVCKPIFALVSRAGDATALLNDMGGTTVVNLLDEEEIYKALPVFLESLRDGTHPRPDRHKILRYTRRNQAHTLAQSLSELKEVGSAKELDASNHLVR